MLLAVSVDIFIHLWTYRRFGIYILAALSETLLLVHHLYRVSLLNKPASLTDGRGSESSGVCIIEKEHPPQPVMLKVQDASSANNAHNANNGYVATGNTDQKPLTMAIESIVSVLVSIKNWAYLKRISTVFDVFSYLLVLVRVCAFSVGAGIP